jgi:hypothetical protein
MQAVASTCFVTHGLRFLTPARDIARSGVAVFVGSYFFRRGAALRGIQMLGSALWIVYGLLIAAKPVIAANHKNLALGRVSVTVRHGKTPAEHCADCGAVTEGRVGKIDRFERVISVEAELDAALRTKLLEIAGKCPVHRTLEMGSAVVTRVEAAAPQS